MSILYASQAFARISHIIVLFETVAKSDQHNDFLTRFNDIILSLMENFFEKIDLFIFVVSFESLIHFHKS